MTDCWISHHAAELLLLREREGKKTKENFFLFLRVFFPVFIRRSG